MHTPISTLKTAARDSESTTVIDLVRRLFNLHDDVHADGAEPAIARPGRGRDSEKNSGKGVRN